MGSNHWISETEMGLFYRLDKDLKYPDLLLAQIKLNEVRNNYQLALEDLNRGLAEMSTFAPFSIEKMKMLLALGQWDTCCETAER